jgi:hypothetical protein
VVRVETKLKRAFEKECVALGLKPSEALRSLMVAFIRLELRHHILTGDEPFARGLTVSEYMGMTEKGRAGLWERWYKEAEVYSRGADVAVKKIAGPHR